MGVDRDTIIGNTGTAFMSHDMGVFDQTTDREVLNTESAHQHEYGERDKSGSFRNFLYHKVPFIDTNEALAGIIGVILDVTEQKQYRRSLKRSRELQEAVLNSIDDVIVVVNADDRTIRMVNPATKKVFGYTSEELIGETTEILHVDRTHFEQFASGWNPSLDAYGTFRTEYPMKRKDGTVFFAEITVSELSSEIGWRAGVVSVIRDISARKEVEEQLRQAQRMDTVGRLAGGIAHDFNNLLTAIGGYLYIATDAVSGNESATAAIDGIRAATARGAQLTHQLLLFSRKSPSEKKRIDLNVAITNIQKMLDRLIGENIFMERVDTEKFLWIDGDEGKIEQVIMNLVLNAADAMPSGGIVRISTRTVEEVASEEGRSTAPGRYALLTVEDQGVGMDSETRAHVFEPFFTTKTKGTGLGLSVVYGIVQEHDGMIRVDSLPDEGSTFSVYLPVTQPGESEPEPPPTQVVSTPESGGRILIVEDETEIIAVVTVALTSAGYEVTAVTDIASALRAWKSAEQPFDVAVVDVILPDGSGVSLLDLLQPHGDTRFVFVSGYLEDKNEFESVRNGGYPFIHKPYAITTLRDVVAEQLFRKQSDADD